MLYCRQNIRKTSCSISVLIFSIIFLWFTAVHASETALKPRTPKDAQELLIKTFPDEDIWTKEIAYFDSAPVPEEKPAILSGNALSELGEKIATRIYGKFSHEDEKHFTQNKYGHYLFQSSALFGLAVNVPKLHLVTNEFSEKKHTGTGVKLLDPNSTGHFALAYINDDIGYGVYALQKLEPGTYIGPFTGMIETAWPKNLMNKDYGWRKGLRIGDIEVGINASLTGSLMTFVNDAPTYLSQDSENYQHWKKNMMEENTGKPDKINGLLARYEPEEQRVARINNERKDKNKSIKNEKDKLPLLPPVPEKAYTANVMVTYYDIVSADKNPAQITFYHVLKPINPYEQILLDYGPGFWEHKGRLYITPELENDLTRNKVK